MRSIRIYDQGYRIALLYKEGRKYDYAITLNTPLRKTRLKKGDYVYKIFSIPDFMVKLKERVITSSTQVANEITELVGHWHCDEDNPYYCQDCGFSYEDTEDFCPYH